MEEDEEDHDGNYDREVEDEDDSERYDLGDDREEEVLEMLSQLRITMKLSFQKFRMWISNETSDLFNSYTVRVPLEV